MPDEEEVRIAAAYARLAAAIAALDDAEEGADERTMQSWQVGIWLLPPNATLEDARKTAFSEPTFRTQVDAVSLDDARAWGAEKAVSFLRLMGSGDARVVVRAARVD